MFTPTSLIIFGLSKILPRVFRKTPWRQKQEHHRCALNHLKNDDLINAVQCNLNSRKNHPDYEKALVLKDILAMRIDAELSQAVTTETLLKKRAEDLHTRLRKIKKPKQNYKTTRLNLGLIIILTMVCSFIFPLNFVLIQIIPEPAATLFTMSMTAALLYGIFIYERKRKLEERLQFERTRSKTQALHKEINRIGKRLGQQRIKKNQLYELKVRLGGGAD